MNIPDAFRRLTEIHCIRPSDILSTHDGFFVVTKALSDILAEKNILGCLNASGQCIACDRFFDDWFLYAVQDGETTYSLLKMREQEHDDAYLADGDDPGVTVSFIAFRHALLHLCLTEPTEAHRQALNKEINRVVSYGGQKHDASLKRYFVRTEAEAPYLIASLYTSRIASFAQQGRLETPDCYKAIYRRGIAKRLPHCIDAINREAGYTVCDHEHIYIRNPNAPTDYERAAIMATHTGNASVYSFAAEVQCHARFLTPWAKFPFIGRTLYDSAIRADMTSGDTEYQGFAPFYRENSRMVKKQIACHKPDHQ